MAKIDVDALPPTQYLILEVLAARHRLGEHHWPFPRRLKPQLEKLEARLLIGFQPAVTERDYRVWLTDYGIEAVMHDGYTMPEQRDVTRSLHGAAAVPAMKMDAYGLWEGICTGCGYRSQPMATSEQAYKCAYEHAFTKNMATARGS